MGIYLVKGSVVNGVKLKDLKEGDYFCLKSLGEKEAKENQVWIKGPYDKSTRKYSCTKFNDVNHEHLYDGNKVVFQDFIF
jgi:hypothetical protein